MGGRHFLTFAHRHVLCPRCGSQVRHRLIGAAVTWLPALAAQVPRQGAFLHLSPEYCLVEFFRPLARRYVRGDFAAEDRDVFVDITNMAGISNASFDVLIACDVLEHIEDDRRAMREIFRILRPGGTAILTVPQADGEVATHEDPAIRTAEQRAKVYGQFDHVRNYGSDFPDRLRAAGFEVTEVDASDFPAELVRRHVLQPPEPLETPWGWNRRRIHFARRPLSS